MANEYLSRTPTVAGNRRTFTISFWSKFALAGVNEKFYSTAVGAGTNAASFFLMTESSGQLHAGAYYSAGGGWANDQQTAPSLRDTSAWYHIVCAVDTTQATSTNRIKLYVNNVLQPKTSGTDPVLNFQYDVNNTVAQYIASAGTDTTANYTGNMSDFFLIDGLALDPSYFGKVDSHKNNQWVAKHPTAIRAAITTVGGFGTNGCYLPLSLRNKLVTTGAGTHRYWRYVEGSALINHHPRVARLYFIKSDGSKTNIATFTTDNNSDTGSITPGTQTFDFTTPVEVVGHGGYVSFNGLRSSNCTIQYSDNNSTWTTAYTSTFQATDFGEHDFHPQIGFDFKTVDRSSKNDWIIYGPTVNKHSTLDVITNNFATMNVNAGFDGAQSKGGLVQTGMNDCLASMGFRSGKYYWEHKILTYAGAGNVLHFGVKNGDFNSGVSVALTSPGILYRNDGQIVRIAGNSCSAWSGSDVTAGTGVTTTAGDIIGVAVDTVSSPASVVFYKNGVAMHSYTFTYTNGLYNLIPYVRNNSGCSSEQNFGQGTFVTSNGGVGYTDANGKGKFQYAPPSGFLSLCEDNLPDISFNPTTGFKAVLYTGNGGGTQAITGVGFKPDFVWIAPLDDNTSWQTLEDANRGAGYYIAPNNNVAEQGSNVLISSFDTDGFTVNYTPNGTTNTTGKHYVAWCWKAGDTNVTNTSGSVTTTVRANNTTGFSVVTYSGTGATTGTVGTGLNGTSMFTFYKGRNNTSDWWVYLGEDDHTRGQLNTTNALYTDGNNAWKHAGLNGQIAFTAGNTDTNLSGINYIMYTWKRVPGFSATGTYAGNGSSNGPFVYLGFKPAWVMIRSRTTARDWIVYDSARGTYNPNNGGAKAVSVTNVYTGSYSTAIDFLSNGFKLRDGTSPNYNGSGETYEYVAFAEQAFDFANAR